MLLNGIPFFLKKISGGRIIPPDYDLSEEWTVPPGGIIPPWM
jgi:adenine/guanine/hypoxanthine permease